MGGLRRCGGASAASDGPQPQVRRRVVEQAEQRQPHQQHDARGDAPVGVHEGVQSSRGRRRSRRSPRTTRSRQRPAVGAHAPRDSWRARVPPVCPSSVIGRPLPLRLLLRSGSRTERRIDPSRKRAIFSTLFASRFPLFAKKTGREYACCSLARKGAPCRKRKSSSTRDRIGPAAREWDRSSAGAASRRTDHVAAAGPSIGPRLSDACLRGAASQSPAIAAGDAAARRGATHRGARRGGVAASWRPTRARWS